MSDKNIKMADYAYPIINKIIGLFPNNYLEIGIFSGQGIKELAREHKDKTLFAVDPFIEDGYTQQDSGYKTQEKMTSKREETMENINGISNISFFEMKSKDFYDALLAGDFPEDFNIDCVFIDGDHSYQACLDDIELAVKLIGEKKGVIFVDDFDLPAISSAVESALVKYKNIHDHGLTTLPRSTFKFYFVN
jgi:predicted O-methyltransferase YrrM